MIACCMVMIPRFAFCGGNAGLTAIASFCLVKIIMFHSYVSRTYVDNARYHAPCGVYGTPINKVNYSGVIGCVWGLILLCLYIGLWTGLISILRYNR